jgi:hypothetical protein
MKEENGTKNVTRDYEEPKILFELFSLITPVMIFFSGLYFVIWKIL